MVLRTRRHNVLLVCFYWSEIISFSNNVRGARRRTSIKELVHTKDSEGITADLIFFREDNQQHVFSCLSISVVLLFFFEFPRCVYLYNNKRVILGGKWMEKLFFTGWVSLSFIWETDSDFFFYKPGIKFSDNIPFINTDVHWLAFFYSFTFFGKSAIMASMDLDLNYGQFCEDASGFTAARQRRAWWSRIPFWASGHHWNADLQHQWHTWLLLDTEENWTVFFPIACSSFTAVLDSR